MLSLEESPDLDGSCVEVLIYLAQQLQASGIELTLTRLKDDVLDLLGRHPDPALARAGQLSGLSVDDSVAQLSKI